MIYLATIKAYKCKPCPLPEGTAWGFAWLEEPTYEPFIMPDVVVGARGLRAAYDLALRTANVRFPDQPLGYKQIDKQWALYASYALRGRPLGPSPEEREKAKAEEAKARVEHHRRRDEADARFRRGERPWRLHSTDHLFEILHRWQGKPSDPGYFDLLREIAYRVDTDRAWRERQRSNTFPSPGRLIILDPFRDLGLTPSASIVEVKRAYRSLVMTAHPDKGGSDAAFVRLTRSYEQALAQAEARAPL